MKLGDEAAMLWSIPTVGALNTATLALTVARIRLKRVPQFHLLHVWFPVMVVLGSGRTLPTLRWGLSRVLVAYTCISSYSGHRDQEDQGSMPAWANSSQDPTQNRAGREAQLIEYLHIEHEALISSPSYAPQKEVGPPRR
jgi:hypothetical protein